MDKILDFSQPFDVTFYDNVVNTMNFSQDPAKVCFTVFYSLLFDFFN